MDLPLDLISFALDLNNSFASEFSLFGKGGGGIAIAILYYLSVHTPQMLYQKEISKISNITEVTIRNRFSEVKSLFENHKQRFLDLLALSSAKNLFDKPFF